MHRAAVPAIVTVIAIVLGTSPAPAQTDTRPVPTLVPKNANGDPLVRLAPADTQTLADALRSVSQQTGVAFVAEGKPFRARNTAPPLAPVAEKWPAVGLSLDDAVAKIADAYDYKAERKGEVFLLRKRYTNPDDLPEVTIDELRFALREASRAASALPTPTVPPAEVNEASTPFIASLFRSLPPDAQASFTNPSTNPSPSTTLSSNALVQIAIPGFVSMQISRLNPQQKNALWQGVLSRHVQEATGAVSNVYKALQTLEQNGTAFSLKSVSPPGKNAAKILIYAPKRSLRAFFPWFADKGEIKRVPPTPSDYEPDGSAIPLFDKSEAAQGQTLQSLCDATAKTAVPAFVVDPALAAKTILVVAPPHTQNAPNDPALREAIFRAAGAVYGLRVLREQTGTLHLTRNRVLTVKELGGINNAILTAYPAPLLRAFRSASAHADSELLTFYRKDRENNPNYKSDPKKLSEEAQFEQFVTKTGGRNMAQLALCYAALHRFRVLTEPRLTSELPVLFSDLSDEARRCLVLAFATCCIKNVDKLREDLPAPTREQVENGTLVGSVRDTMLTRPENAAQKSERRFTFSITLRPDVNKSDGGHSYDVGFLTLRSKP